MSQIEKKESWKMFDTISSTYDRINKILSFGMDRGWRKKLSRSLPEKRSLKILDLATGTGDQLFSILETSSEIDSAIGLDMAEKMIEIAKNKAKSKPYCKKIDWILGDAETLPFVDDRFDLVSFSFGIRNVEDPKKSLSEIYRVLAPKGRCLILEFSLPPHPIRPLYLFYLRKLLPKIGGILSKSTPAYQYLNETIETFPSGEDFLNLMKGASFQNVKGYKMAFGAVTLYSGDKLC